MASTALADAALGKFRRSKTDRAMTSFGRVMKGTICTGCGWVRAGTGILRNMHEKIRAKSMAQGKNSQLPHVRKAVLGS